MLRDTLYRQFKVRREFWLWLVVYLVGIHGLFVIATTLVDQFRTHPGMRVTGIDIDIPLLIGFGLVYLSTLLRRRKRTAWSVAIVAYIFMLGFYAQQSSLAVQHHDMAQVISKLGLPLLNICLLSLYHKSFTVKSDIRSFGYALRFIVLILLTALIYGTVGFMLMDTSDFRHNIGFGEGLRRTVDQFDLQTSNGDVSTTRRARLFVDSLSVVSVAALTTAAVSLFQPTRAYYSRRHEGYTTARTLLEHSGGSSEDFFKLWPHDKAYYFGPTLKSGVAYRTRRGFAIVAGDPFGERAAAAAMLRGFEDLCYGNDWSPVFLHTLPAWNDFYERHGYHLQKIGEEAVIDLAHFQAVVSDNKYFREIRNKFARKGYSSELLLPPHDEALLSRLRTVSADWLQTPGRTERGLVMGFFSDAYLQQCPVVIARDSAGTIQGFLNQIESFDSAEANFDMLRHTSDALGNCSDFLLLSFIEYLLPNATLKRLNLGLCPLSGMDDIADKSMVTRALEFVYANGDRFYSFSGLHRFKSKYQPEWRDRYMAYKGNPTNFVRATNAVTRAMRVDKKLLDR